MSTLFCMDFIVNSDSLCKMYEIKYPFDNDSVPTDQGVFQQPF